jgi:hypothetical protein
LMAGISTCVSQVAYRSGNEIVASVVEK